MDTEAYRIEYNDYIDNLSSEIATYTPPLTEICAEFTKIEKDSTNVFSLRIISETKVYIQAYLDIIDSTKEKFTTAKLTEDSNPELLQLESYKTSFNTQKLNLANHLRILLPIAKNALGVAQNIMLLQNILKIDPINEFNNNRLNLIPPQYQQFVQSVRHGYSEHMRTLGMLNTVLAPIQGSYSSFNQFINTLKF